jgi:hypothetical protein
MELVFIEQRTDPQIVDTEDSNAFLFGQVAK